MKFKCGKCGVVEEVHTSRFYKSWRPCKECGAETRYDNAIGSGAEPKSLDVRGGESKTEPPAEEHEEKKVDFVVKQEVGEDVKAETPMGQAIKESEKKEPESGFTNRKFRRGRR